MTKGANQLLYDKLKGPTDLAHLHSHEGLNFLVRAAICADMRLKGFKPNVEGDPDQGFWNPEPIDFQDPSGTGSVKAYLNVAGPQHGGVLTYNRRRIYPNDGSAESLSTGPADYSYMENVFRRWPDEINRAFHGWLQIPDGHLFDTVSKHLNNALKLINPNPDTTIKGVALPDTTYNKALQDVILSELNPAVKDMTGKTATAFKNKYVFTFNDVFTAQGNFLIAISLALGAQRGLYVAARYNVVKIAQLAAAAFDAIQKGGGQGNDKALTDDLGLISSGAAVLGLIPGAGAVTAPISSATSLLSAIITKVDESYHKSQKTVALGAPSPDGVKQNIEAALDKLMKAGATTRFDLEQALINVVNTVAEQLGTYRLPHLEERIGAGLESNSDPIHINIKDARRVTGEYLPGLAKWAEEAAREVQKSLDPGPWEQPPVVCNRREGFYPNFANAVDLLTNLLDDTATTLVRVADLFDAFIDEMENHDNGAAERAHHLIRELEHGTGIPTPTKPRIGPDGEEEGIRTDTERKKLLEELDHRLGSHRDGY